MAKNSIRERLENWGMFQRAGTHTGGAGMRAKETRSASPYGGQGYKCMTSVICNMLATSATGPAGWRETRHGAAMTSEEIADAKLVSGAWVRLSERPKSMLKWCYVLNKPPGEICRHLGIRAWPASHFKAELHAAEVAIAKFLDNIEKENKIPSNNLIPSGQTCGYPAGGATVTGGIEKALD